MGFESPNNNENQETIQALQEELEAAKRSLKRWEDMVQSDIDSSKTETLKNMNRKRVERNKEIIREIEQEIVELRGKKAENSSMSGSINESGEFIRGEDVNSENLKGHINERGEFVRGKSINETKPEEDGELPVHLL